MLTMQKQPSKNAKRVGNRQIKPVYLVVLSISFFLLAMSGFYVFGGQTESHSTNTLQFDTEENRQPEIPPTPSELLELTNIERAKVGVAPLKLDERLNQSAQAKADDMVANNYYDHINPITGITGHDLIPYKEIGCTTRSENLAMHYKDSPIAGFNTSKPHWDAILDTKFNLIGFGTTNEYLVVHFCDL